MLVCLSDLHFQDVTLRQPQQFSSNVKIRAFELFFNHIRELAERNKAQEITVVLAGDIFELHRAEQWFRDNRLRPYSGDLASPELTSVLLDIFTGIKESNKEIFDLFQETLSDKSGIPLTFHYLPGNHDREVNLCYPLNQQVRQVLGLEAKREDEDWRFPYWQHFSNYRAYVRHGHEYDPANCVNFIVRKNPPYHPDNLPLYLQPCLGDYVTIDFAAYLPCLYHRLYKGKIEDSLFKRVYQRLLSFDDLRPQSAMARWLDFPEPEANKSIEDTLKCLLGEKLQDQQFYDLLAPLKPIASRLLQTFANNRLLKHSLNLISVKRLFTFLLEHLPSAARAAHTYAAEEDFSRYLEGKPEVLYLVSGHSHKPDMIPIQNRKTGDKQIFFDTGTFRKRITHIYGSGKSAPGFTTTKTMTYVVIYKEGEDGNEPGETSFEVWTGQMKKRGV